MEFWEHNGGCTATHGLAVRQKAYATSALLGTYPSPRTQSTAQARIMLKVGDKVIRYVDFYFSQVDC